MPVAVWWGMGYTALYLLALGVLLLVAGRNRKYYAPAKGFASILFVLASLLALFVGGGSFSAAFMLLLGALVLCAFGDIFLGVANRTPKVRARPFLAGTVSFALAHVLFCVFFYARAQAAWYDILLPGALVVVLATLEAHGKIRLKSMKIPAYVYAFLIGLMASKAVQAALVWPGAAGGVLAAAGALLFLASDIVLLFLYFGVKRQKWYRYVNLTMYYCGVYMLALLAFWI